MKRKGQVDFEFCFLVGCVFTSAVLICGMHGCTEINKPKPEKVLVKCSCCKCDKCDCAK